MAVLDQSFQWITADRCKGAPVGSGPGDEHKGELYVVDNCSDTIDPMGTWPGVGLYHERFHSRPDSDCRRGCVGQANFRPKGDVMPRVSRKGFYEYYDHYRRDSDCARRGGAYLRRHYLYYQQECR